MKLRILGAASLTLLAAFAPVRAAIDILDPNYAVVSYYGDDDADMIVSYDWSSSGDLYYMSLDVEGWDSLFGGLHRVSGGVASTVVPGSAAYGGTSVVAIGGFVYYNTNDFSDEYVYKFDIAGNSPSLASTTPNYGLYKHQGALFITGAAGFGTNHVYHSLLDGQGGLISDPAADLGVTSGNSGPLAFDLAGNLYYAPGYGDLSIYKWSAAELAAAIDDPDANPLTIGDPWLEYDGLFGSVSGATSMLLDGDGNLLLTLSNFGGPSVLARFGIGEDGSYDATWTTIFEDSGRLGELRSHLGEIYVSSDNQIYRVVPEPSALLLVIGGLGGFLLLRRRRSAAVTFSSTPGAPAPKA